MATPGSSVAFWRERVFVNILMMAILPSMRWYLHVVLIFTSLINSSIEHLFTCLLAICMSSLETCLFRSPAHFFDWIVWLFLVVWHWALWALWLLWKLIPVSCIICKYFLPLFRLSFIILTVSFAVQKHLSLIRSHWFVFTFHYSRRQIWKTVAVIYVKECSAYVFP